MNRSTLIPVGRLAVLALAGALSMGLVDTATAQSINTARGGAAQWLPQHAANAVSKPHATKTRMSCPKCKNVWEWDYGGFDYQPGSWWPWIASATKKHQCEGCQALRKAGTESKASPKLAALTCGSCGAKERACCAKAKGQTYTVGMEPQ